MAEAESGRGEFVQDGRIQSRIVVWAESWIERIEAEFLHFVSADDDGQPFVIGDVLHLSSYNSLGLLIETLVVPMRIEVLKFLRDSVVLSQKDGMRHGHVGIFGISIITCASLYISLKLIKVKASRRMMYIGVHTLE